MPPLPPVKSITLAAMSEDASSYPLIELSNFDLIVFHPLSFSPSDQNSEPISRRHYHRLPPPLIADLSTDLIAFLYFWLFDQWASGWMGLIWLSFGLNGISGIWVDLAFFWVEWGFGYVGRYGRVSWWCLAGWVDDGGGWLLGDGGWSVRER